MLYVLFAVTILFLIANFMIAKHDYMHPSVLFCMMFLIYEFVCILGQSAFAITIHWETVLVLTAGMTVFTIISFIFSLRKVAEPEGIEDYSHKGEAKLITINNLWVICLLIIQIITIVFFIKYLREISVAYCGKDGSLSQDIALYNNMTKFWTSLFRRLNVKIPIFYRIGNPISEAGAYLILFVSVNNFVAAKKINVLHILSVLLLCVSIVLNGSRSPLFRVLTMALILFYILNYKAGKSAEKKKINFKFLIALVLIVLAAAAFFIGLLSIMGRVRINNIFSYIFIYLGAPIVNLDNYIIKNNIVPASGLFGAQTFRNLYAYIGKILGINYLTYPGISIFAHSSNGIEIGNVYTMYYSFIYDFGYWGIIPMVSIMALYYIGIYDIILKRKDCLSNFNLFIYSYLINDLIMSPFSSRFYSTILDAPFIKLFILTWLLNSLVIERKIHIGKFRIGVPDVGGIAEQKLRTFTSALLRKFKSKR